MCIRDSCRKGQGDSGLVLVDLAFGMLTEYIIDRALCKLDSCRNGCAHNVALRLCIAAMARTAESADSALVIEKFDARHKLQRDLFDLHLSVRLSVALEGLGVLLGTVLEDANLLALAILQNLSLNLSTCNCGGTELGVSTVDNCQNLIEGDGLLSLRRELLDVDRCV